MAEAWYAIRSKPHKEDFLWGQLAARKIETFYPRIKVQPQNPRAKKVRPYFPGYLFVRVDLGDITSSSLQWMPGAVGVVSFDGQPSSIPETLIMAIRQRIDQDNAAMKASRTGFKPGEAVIVQTGPFAGYEAIFDSSLPGEDRVRVLLKMINHRQVLVDLSGGQIYRKNHSHVPGRKA
ncbi:MAG: hypothetical protein JXA13_06275 [Anaerolineales bacterium]|nr:hypothetical protein [Anaerolineales bacterium]